MADQAAQQTLEIRVKYKDDGASKSLQTLRKDIEAIESASRGQGFQHLKSVADSMSALGQAASGLKGVGPSFQNVAKSAEDLFQKFKSFDLNSFNQSVKGVTDSLNSMSKSLSGLKGFDHVANGLARISKLASDKNLATNLQNTAQQVVAFAQNVTSNISDDVLNRFERLGSAMAGLSSGAGKSFDVTALDRSMAASTRSVLNLGNAMGKLKKAATGVGKSFVWLGRRMADVIALSLQIGKLPFNLILSPLQSIGNGLLGMTKKFTSFLSGIGRIALYRAIRTGIKLVTSSIREGVNNLYIWAGMVGNSFKPTMDSLATSFLYLKNSIGAAVSPILDTLAPAFDFLIDKIVDVLNVFNQVISSITGASTWRKAIKAPANYADNISGLGHEAEDANDAVKELKRTVLGFDEINKLEDKTKTLTPKKAGKDATGLYANQGAFSFEEVKISEKAIDIAKKLKEAWERGDFTSIGTMIGKKVGDALQNIPWETKIKPTVKKLATSFGTLLNGMFDYTGEGGKAMWDGIASLIYNGINTAVLGYTTFFDTVNWDGIGQGVGAALKSVLRNINWTEGENSVASALAAFPNAIIDAVTGFTKQFTTEDFYTAGQNIGKTVSKALTKINWTGLFGNAVTIATGVLAALNGALKSFDWTGVKNAILSGLQKIKKTEWSNLGKELGSAIINVASFLTNVVSTVGSALSRVNWASIISGIKTGIDTALKDNKITLSSENVSSALASFPNTIIDAITAFCKSFTTKDFEDAGKYIGETVSKTISKINWKDLFTNTFSIATRIVAAFNGALTGFNWSSVKGAILGGIKGVEKKTWSDLGKEIGEAIFNVTAFVANLVDTFIKLVKLGDWGALFQGIKDGITNGMKQYGGFSGVAKKLAGWFSDNLDVLELVLAFSVGKIAIKALATTFASSVLSKLGMAKVPGTALSLGKWAKGVSIATGVVMAVDTIKTILDADLDKDNIKEYLGNSLDIAMRGALSGGSFGFGIGGFTGGVYGMIIGAGLSLSIGSLVATAEKSGVWSPEFLTKLATELTCAAIGFVVGGPAGAALGLAIGADLDIIIEEVIPKGLDKIDTFVDTLYERLGIGPVSRDEKNRGVAGNKHDSGDFGGGSASIAVEESTKRGSADTRVTPFVFKPVVDLSELPTEWQSLSKAWDSLVKVNKVAAFLTEGVQDDSVSWWDLVKKYWGTEITGQTASSFTVGGVEDKSSDWWTSVKDYWSNIIAGDFAKKFNVEGIVDEAKSWWGSVKKYWSDETSKKFAKKFNVEGIEDKAKTWWTSVKKYWSDEISWKYAKKFNVEGIEDKAKTWWSSVKKYWSDEISGKHAEKFNVEGIVDSASKWWGEVKKYWSDEISGQTAEKFNIEGIVDSAYDWWISVQSYWSDEIRGQEADAFSLAGVVDDALEWWNQTVNYWNSATSGSDLDASVIISNATDAFNSAWQSMQTNFTNNPLTATVNVVQQAVAPAVASAQTYQDVGTTTIDTSTSEPDSLPTISDIVLDLGDDAINVTNPTKKAKSIKKKKKKKATGGIYKNGAYAAGALGVNSGQMFIAREAGPELVGTIGGDTAVMNNDQIVSSVAAGVRQAVIEAFIQAGGNTNDITIKLDSEVLYRAVRKGEKTSSGRYSTVVAVG